MKIPFLILTTIFFVGVTRFLSEDAVDLPMLGMTDIVKVALITATGPTLVAGVGVIVSVINTLKANNIIGAAKEIHTLTNSNLTKVTGNLDLALKEIQGLREQINQMRKDKDVADALARKPDDVVPPTVEATVIIAPEPDKKRTQKIK